MQLLRCLCRFTSGQSELSIIIIELHYEPTFTVQVHIRVQGGAHRVTMGAFLFKDPLQKALQEKISLQ